MGNMGGEDSISMRGGSSLTSALWSRGEDPTVSQFKRMRNTFYERADDFVEWDCLSHEYAPLTVVYTVLRHNNVTRVCIDKRVSPIKVPQKN